ncbi:MAG: fibronectin type III domain-containing protein [Desulfomonilia bacterium]|jgi:hypothetical protein
MKGKIGTFFLLPVLATILCCPAQLSASSLKVSWNPNTEPDLAGYRVHYGTTSGEYRNIVDAGASTEVVLDGFFEGRRYFFAVTARTPSSG